MEDTIMTTESHDDQRNGGIVPSRRGLYRLLILALLAALAAGCQSPGVGAATARDAAGNVSAHHHHHRAHHAAKTPPGWWQTPGAAACGLPALKPNKHRSRAQAERYAARALACARREHRSAYWPYPGDRVCLTAALTLSGRSGDVGAAIQGTPVRLAHPVVPGQSETLPPVWIADNSSGAETMILTVRNVYPFCSDVLPASWISGTGQPISLAAGQGDYVTGLRVTVPAGTQPGTYRSDLVVSASAGNASGLGGNARFGAGGAVVIIVAVS
jgi:hypothetical protein